MMWSSSRIITRDFKLSLTVKKCFLTSTLLRLILLIFYSSLFCSNLTLTLTSSKCAFYWLLVLLREFLLIIYSLSFSTIYNLSNWSWSQPPSLSLAESLWLMNRWWLGAWTFNILLDIYCHGFHLFTTIPSSLKSKLPTN